MDRSETPRSPLSPDDFARLTREKLRYADMDRQGHVNNAVYTTLFESGRVGIFYDPARDLPPAGYEFVLARIEIDFLAEMRWPGEVVIGSSVTRLGRSSVTMRQAVFCDGRATATALSVGVLMDSAARHGAPLPEPTRAALGASMRNM